MADEYRFDDDGAPHDPDAPTQAEIDSPAVDTFTAIMEDGVEAAIQQDDDSVVIVTVRAEVVEALQGRLSAALVGQLKESGHVLHREAHLALANAFLWLANNELAACDLDTFEANRDAIMHVLGVLATAILDSKPGHAHLVDADPVTEVVQ